MRLIDDLGKWIIKKSMEQLSIWNRDIDVEIDMSINISTTQLRDETFVSYVRERINLYKLNPKNIKLEITESFAVGEDQVTRNQIKSLLI